MLSITRAHKPEVDFVAFVFPASSSVLVGAGWVVSLAEDHSFSTWVVDIGVATQDGELAIL